ncbi:LysM peptidoglycan-binding domain-containing protein [uncultured Flavobacterium sp.]|uniref:LysM peptidoglycan-binding domain-containing protein n=1 Tax=uncultured Flavobacterium sp. TaxID=165435 RepID=UPI0030EEC593|tara:strand:- start:151956 stop:153290 length:1335 start_codon:yes stop_codon:yes gene_type:complete
MNRFLLIFLFFALSTFNSFAQKTTKHKVVSGDSFYSIAKKYGVTESDIYELNPKAKGQTLQLNAVLVIPTGKITKKVTKDFHEVGSGESFYTIARKYDLTVEELKDFNPSISPNKLQVGAKLALIKNKNSKDPKANKKEEASTSNDLVHSVKKGETISHITEKYDVSFKELKKLNPGLDVKLQIDEKIIVRKGKEKAKKEIIQPKVESIKIISPSSVQIETMAAADDDIEEPDDSGEVTHVVVSGETLMSIARTNKITLGKLQELNPKIGDKIFPGRKLIIKKGVSSNTKNTTVVYAELEEFVEDAQPMSVENIESADQLIAIASEHLGTRYRSGGTKSGGFDCSGLMCYTFSQMDFKLPRTSNEQSRTGKKVKKTQAQKGDLIFFSTNGRGSVNHVGMITEVVDDEIFFIHSSVSRGVIVSSVKEAYYAKRFIRINRVLDIVN